MLAFCKVLSTADPISLAEGSHSESEQTPSGIDTIHHGKFLKRGATWNNYEAARELLLRLLNGVTESDMRTLMANMLYGFQNSDKRSSFVFLPPAFPSI